MNQAGGSLFTTPPLAQNQNGDIASASSAAWARSFRMIGLIPMKKASSLISSTSSLVISASIASHTPERWLPDDHCKSTVVEGSDKVVPCAQANRFLSLTNIAGVTNQDNRQCGTKPAQPAQDVQAIDIALRQIQQKQIRRYP